MTEREKIEHEIRKVLENESRAAPLSNKLFAPDGLFSRLAGTEAERRALVRTPLFKEAQRRFSALQRVEAKAFAKLAEQLQAVIPQGEYLLKLEWVEAGGGPDPRPCGLRAAAQREGQSGARPEATDGSGQS